MIDLAVVDVARPIGSGKVFNGAGFATGDGPIAGQGNIARIFSGAPYFELINSPAHLGTQIEVL